MYRKTIAVAIAFGALVLPGTALAWPGPVEGQPVCIPNGNGTFTIGTAGPTSPPGSHQPENGTCEGPVVTPPAPSTTTTAAPPAAAGPPPAPAAAPPAPPAPAQAAPPEAPPIQGTAPPQVGACSTCGQESPPEKPKPSAPITELTQPVSQPAVARPTPRTAPISSLPYTGWETWLIAGLGASLLGLGLYGRRVAQRAG